MLFGLGLSDHALAFLMISFSSFQLGSKSLNSDVGTYSFGSNLNSLSCSVNFRGFIYLCPLAFLKSELFVFLKLFDELEGILSSSLSSGCCFSQSISFIGDASS